MTCPKYIDYTRECISEVEFMPLNTLELCSSDQHEKCPFYMIVSGNKNVCKNIKKCPAFKNFSTEKFKEFIVISNKYCVSENHKECKRYVLKEEGEKVPVDLHPDGHTVEEWSKEEE